MNTITPGMAGFEDGSGINAIICSVDGVNISLLEFSNLELGVIKGDTLGG
jgi:hypothetical protein